MFKTIPFIFEAAPSRLSIIVLRDFAGIGSVPQYGPVCYVVWGGALSGGRPYPDMLFLYLLIQIHSNLNPVCF